MRYKVKKYFFNEQQNENDIKRDNNKNLVLSETYINAKTIIPGKLEYESMNKDAEKNYIYSQDDHVELSVECMEKESTSCKNIENDDRNKLKYNLECENLCKYNATKTSNEKLIENGEDLFEKKTKK
ncbi:hypothetical protein EDEG_01633 [Edhazardia aedis USNM 41457]|uniref:Uncharacterized protein n=1 Tax=Edhazardia aedis (strain USNM 41457) TaxID=1003232 RepID=J9DRZ1_EDHAE|nr:hypothetical protein EDEG_01633 [Edhazardia aedis USNM 41457]|eukprot:EJW04057.1 hypothetical protein EDEG_01633 [Edhazardia aedis USNM 41457]